MPDPSTDELTSVALVVTDRPARYGKQLVSHFNRRTTGEWDERAEVGWVKFGDGSVRLTAGPQGLNLHLVVEGPEHLAVLEGVVGRHLVRFGARDELVVSWVRADGTTGTTQENSAD